MGKIFEPLKARSLPFPSGLFSDIQMRTMSVELACRMWLEKNVRESITRLRRDVSEWVGVRNRLLGI